MTHQNLILTEEAIKSHCKRLKKELKNLDKDLTLCEIQTLFSKSLGFNNFHELKTMLVNKKEITNNKTITDDIFLRFIQEIEHKSDYIWITSDNDFSYIPHGVDFSSNGNKEHITIDKKIFNNKELKIFIDSLICQIPNYQKEMDRQILLFPSQYQAYDLSFSKETTIDDGLYRKLFYQIYFDNNKNILGIKVLISYKLKNDVISFSYQDIKHLFCQKNLSLKMAQENIKKDQQKRFFAINTHKYSIKPHYLDLFNLCMKGSLVNLKEFLHSYDQLDFNELIPDRTWEPQTAIELALAFENFEIVHYLISNAKILKINLHSSDDYLLRHCCLEGSNEHFKIVKKLYQETDFTHLPTSTVSFHNILTSAYNSNKKLAQYLRKQISH